MLASERRRLLSKKKAPSAPRTISFMGVLAWGAASGLGAMAVSHLFKLFGSDEFKTMETEGATEIALLGGVSGSALSILCMLCLKAPSKTRSCMRTLLENLCVTGAVVGSSIGFKYLLKSEVSDKVLGMSVGIGAPAVMLLTSVMDRCCRARKGDKSKKMSPPV